MYDCLVVGGGPCGVSASIYLKRAGYNVAVIEKKFIGGQVSISSSLENYAGFVDKDAFTFCQNLSKQLKELLIPVISGEVEEIEEIKDNCFKVKTKKDEHLAKSIILSIGAESRKLGLDFERDYFGRGVSYCAVCDGSFYRKKNVLVVGGGNSAFEDALYLANFCSKVYLINRSEKFRAEQIYQDKLRSLSIENGGNVEILVNATISSLCGKDCVEKAIISQNGEHKELDVQGVFIAIGREPKSEFVQNFVELQGGYIKVDANFQTSRKGVFAGGDCILKEFRQVVTAVSDGAYLSKQVSNFLQHK